MAITIEIFLSFIVGIGKTDTTTNLFVLQWANEMILQFYTLKFLKYTITLLIIAHAYTNGVVYYDMQRHPSLFAKIKTINL